MHWLAQPHSGWMSRSASGCVVERPGDVVGADAGVHVALARPDLHLPAGDALEVGPEEHVGQEQDLAVGRDGLDHGAALPEVQQ